MHSWNGYKKFAWGFDELMPKVCYTYMPSQGLGVLQCVFVCVCVRARARANVL
jgi:hypothetical protein